VGWGELERHLTVRMLGSVRLFLDGCLLEFPTLKACCLLCYLITHRHQWHTRSHLAALFWEQSGLIKSKNSLNTALSSLRRLLPAPEGGEPFLIADRTAVRFNPKSDHWLDVERFETLVHRARDQRSAACYREAMSHYRGAFMLGVEDAWCEPMRARCRALMLEACDALVAATRRERHYDQAIRWAERILQTVPSRERTHVALIEIYDELNDRQAAVQQYERCVSALSNLGLRPHRTTQRLLQRVRHGGVSVLDVEADGE